MTDRQLRTEIDRLTYRFDRIGSHPLTVSSAARRRAIEGQLKLLKAEVERRTQKRNVQ